jgi:hypothetical protein
VTLVLDEGWMKVIAQNHEVVESGEVFVWESSEPLDWEVEADDTLPPHVIHFGVYPERGASMPLVDGHHDSTGEYEFTLYPPNGVGEAKAIVSGSWACWGPADQLTDGDDSLHVLVYVDHVPTTAEVEALHYALGDVTSGRILDHAWIGSSEDWSEISHIATLVGHPTVAKVSPR